MKFLTFTKLIKFDKFSIFSTNLIDFWIDNGLVIPFGIFLIWRPCLKDLTFAFEQNRLPFRSLPFYLPNVVILIVIPGDD